MKRIPRVFGDLDALEYVDGRHDEARRAAFAGHLAEHPADAERVAMWMRQNQVLQSTFAGVLQESVPISLRPGRAVAVDARKPTAQVDRPPVLRALQPGSTPRIIDRQAAASAERRVISEKRNRSAIRLPIAVLAPVLATCFVLVAIHALLSSNGVHRPTPARTDMPAGMSRAAEAFDTYAVDPTHPVEFVPSQMPSFGRWIQRRLGLTIEPANLQAEGWSLLGARLVPGDITPAVFFIYEDKIGDRLGLWVTRAPMGTGAPTMSLQTGLGEDASMGWNAQRGLAYVVTVGKSLDWLSRNAEVLRNKVEAGAS